ncbi:MAG: 30S ribosomal protein S4e [Nanoarchaeota archaeon]|nr:30S ribosomal protein S4e [Nanoarchaeota archaeon]
MKSHLKRIAAPKSWQILRKERKWLVRSMPGAHRKERSLPLAVLIRDLLAFAKTMREVKNILTKKQVLINGKREKNEKRCVGLMDVVTFKDINESYRILIDKNERIVAKKIEKKTEVDLKPYKIKNKTLVKGKVQLNFSSGGNLIVEKDIYKTGDTLLMNVQKKEPGQHFKLEKGAVIYLTGGTHIGEQGIIESIEGKKIVMKIHDQQFETLKKYAFVIGKEKSAIDIN